jgi:hypothetical protein
MFIVSSSNLMASFSGHHDFLKASGSGLEIAEDAAGSLNDYVEERKFSTGLKRTVSSLHSSLSAAIPEQSCSHANHKNNCIVEAKQVEMDFATLTNRPFQLNVTAPNGERSQKFQFLAYGQSARFSPCMNGCGHGNWTFEIRSLEKSGETQTETIYLDGVGSLFFTVDEHLHMRLSSQEFLRLPSASQCCSSSSNKKMPFRL